MTQIKGKPRDFNKKNGDGTAWLMSGLFGVFTGLFLVLGYQLEKYDSLRLTDKNSLLILLLIIVVITIDTKHVWNNYNGAENGLKLFGLIDISKYRTGQESREIKVIGRDFFNTWICLVVLNLPVLLAEYPGFFVYDAQYELNEVLTRNFTTQHPLLHVFLLGGTIALVHKMGGSWNAGIFAYIFLQMLVITAIFSYAINYIKKRGAGKNSRILCTLYYGLFPSIVMFTLCSSKDGIFSALLLLLTIFLIQLVSDTEVFLGDKRKIFAFVLTAVLMPCFRHNGFYAYLVFVPFGLIFFRKKMKKSLVAMLVLPVALYLVINAALSSVSVNGTNHQEMLTVPIMQLARVYTYEKDSMTVEEIQTLISYIPEENLKLYTPRLSDMVKIGFNNSLYEQDSVSFMKLWLSNLIKHPMTYINSWLLTSYGYWYPAARINVYKGTTVFTFTYDTNSYFGYEVELPGERRSLMPVIDSFYRYISIGDLYEDCPILGLVLSPGLAFMIFLFVFCYRLSRKNFGGIIPFMPMFLTFLTVLLGPTYLPRYVAYLWMCMPLLMIQQ